MEKRLNHGDWQALETNKGYFMGDEEAVDWRKLFSIMFDKLEKQIKVKRENPSAGA